MLQFDIRSVAPVMDGDDLVIGDYRVKNIDDYDLVFTFDKEGVAVGLTILSKGHGDDYARGENCRDVQRWANGDFTTGGLTKFFEECVNKNVYE